MSSPQPQARSMETTPGIMSGSSESPSNLYAADSLLNPSTILEHLEWLLCCSRDRPRERLRAPLHQQGVAWKLSQTLLLLTRKRMPSACTPRRIPSTHNVAGIDRAWSCLERQPRQNSPRSPREHPDPAVWRQEINVLRTSLLVQSSMASCYLVYETSFSDTPRHGGISHFQKSGNKPAPRGKV